MPLTLACVQVTTEVNTADYFASSVTASSTERLVRVRFWCKPDLYLPRQGENQLVPKGVGMNLLAHPSYAKATPEQRAAICNGCGAAGAKFDFVPDTIYGLKISEACFRHDWRYHLGTTLEEKAHADWEFLQNLLMIIESAPGFLNKTLRIPRRARAMKYYGAVRDFGDEAFFAGKI